MIDLTVWWDKFSAALQYPAFQAVFIALIMGLALTEAMAWLLPARWTPLFAERTLRVCVLVAVAFTGYKLHPTVFGAGLSFTVGLLAPSLHHHWQSWAYNKYPWLRPKVWRHDVYRGPDDDK